MGHTNMAGVTQINDVAVHHASGDCLPPLVCVGRSSGISREARECVIAMIF